mgnify:CR=1 FL=1
MRILAAVLMIIFTAGQVYANQPLVSVDWLQSKLDDKSVVVVDLRNKIDKGGIEVFRKGHIPGSIHSDYLKAGWRVTKNNVPGLLPQQADFEKLVSELGISNTNHVVLVPAGVSSSDFGSSARAYWQFRVYGHDRVSILDGGYAAWAKALPDHVERGDGRSPTPAVFNATFRTDLYVDTMEVASIAKDGAAILLDGRNQSQWKGKAKHPAARSPGRIPGSVWQWQGDSYDESTNRLKSRSALAGVFNSVKDGPVVSYCNTGHWAATNWFVLSEILGRKNIRLYDGSMTAWSADPSLPLVTEQTKLDDIKDWLKEKLKKS